MEKYIAYFKKVFADSANAENRPNDVHFWTAELDGVIFLAISGNFARVIKRAMYRLKNNFHKNFGKNLCMVTFNRGVFSPAECNYSCPYCLDVNYPVDVNHTIYQEVTPFGNVSIQVYVNMDEMDSTAFSFVTPDYFLKGETMPNGYYEKLLQHFDSSDFATWPGYCHCFEELYGKQPPAMKAIKTHIE